MVLAECRDCPATRMMGVTLADVHALASHRVANRVDVMARQECCELPFVADTPLVGGYEENRSLIYGVCIEERWYLARAARRLGICWSTMVSLMQRWGVDYKKLKAQNALLMSSGAMIVCNVVRDGKVVRIMPR